MSASLPRVAPTPVPPVRAPAPAAQAVPTPPDRVLERAAPGRPFAELLRQRRSEAAPPAPAAPPRPAASEPGSPGTAAESGAAFDGEAGTAASGPEKNVASARARARQAQSAKAAADPGRGPRDAAPADAGARDDAATDTSTDRAPGAAESAPLRPLPLPEDTSGPDGRFGRQAGARDDGDAGGDAAEASDGQAAASASASRSRRSAGRPAVDDSRSGRGDGPRPGDASPPARVGAATPGTERTPAAEAGAARGSFELRLPPALGVPAATLPAVAGEPPPPGTPVPTLALPTPLDSPQFAGALGARVSLLVEGGVHAAELHLNPAEMGPVSIRIRLDGSDAQVQFGADLAETRQAIEAGLPELASALRDAGFTLSGGGVSARAGQGDTHGGGDGSAATTARPAATTTADAASPGAPTSAAVRHVAAGGVDVYA